ncbi:uncharacterized protein LAESUDRAFT_763318 [Laetiporus sulphureus 93-53]|uniref:Uncharacterized protein n=1 Tax=Laetiporus sulphureus 93-53 TaxID=1314785 RepID=A0A165BYH1_9APHY|nr:uncharacterized protein LAESUDRAFT_763318 [Laetiporus sulphureus 93-53]KZT01879.1 hypothetical protein LAESUDRAFT_763318 [Laetiporus sulphureus 93-53]
MQVALLAKTGKMKSKSNCKNNVKKSARCTYTACKKKGHMEDKCRKKNADLASRKARHRTTPVTKLQRLRRPCLYAMKTTRSFTYSSLNLSQSAHYVSGHSGSSIPAHRLPCALNATGSFILKARYTGMGLARRCTVHQEDFSLGNWTLSWNFGAAMDLKTEEGALCFYERGKEGDLRHGCHARDGNLR